MSPNWIEKSVEVLLIAALIGPLVRVGCSRPFRRKLRVFPRIGGLLLALLIGCVGIVGLAVFLYPALLRGLAIVAASSLAYTLWRARPAYGRARGLPPGSLRLAPMDPWRRDRFYLEQSVRHGPVFKMSNYVQPMVCVLGLSRARELLRQHEDALRVAPLPFNRFIPRGFLRYMPREPHRQYRDVFRTALSGEVVSELEPSMTRAVQAGLARLERASVPSGAAPQPHLLRLVQTIFLRVFFGLPDDSPVAARSRDLYGIIDYRAAYRTRPAAVRRALSEFARVLEAQVVAHAEPRMTTDAPARSGDLAGSFLGRLVEADARLLKDPTVTGNLVFISQATAIDVAELLTWLLKMLSDHPEWARRLRDELYASEVRFPAEHDPTGLADRIVSETLRLEQSEYVMRQTLADLTWEGFVIPRGWQVRICVRESHRDPNAFESPETFDPDRHLERAYGSNELAPFGIHGVVCLGEDLTRTVARIFVTELVRGYEWTVVEDGPREFGGFHWRPSSRLRVRLEAR